MKRPRKYFDRRWLDGYTAVAVQLPRLPFWQADGAGVKYRIYTLVRQSKPLTAYECGCVDALLDSVGC